jgi:hypothetical protein
LASGVLLSSANYQIHFNTPCQLIVLPSFATGAFLLRLCKIKTVAHFRSRSFASSVRSTKPDLLRFVCFSKKETSALLLVLIVFLNQDAVDLFVFTESVRIQFTKRHFRPPFPCLPLPQALARSLCSGRFFASILTTDLYSKPTSFFSTDAPFSLSLSLSSAVVTSLLFVRIIGLSIVSLFSHPFIK